jgi:hypothetical protein
MADYYDKKLYANGEKFILDDGCMVFSGNFMIVSSTISVETPYQDFSIPGGYRRYFCEREVTELELHLRIFDPVIDRYADSSSPGRKSQIESLLLGGIDTSNQALMKKIYENMESRDA